MKFNLIVAVWGRDYINCFCDVTLPSLAISRGDADVVEAHSWTVVVYAPEADHDRIRATVHDRLPFAAVDCVAYEPDGRQNPYTAMSVAHHRAAVQTIADSAWAVVVPPDAVFSAGSLRYVAEACASGKRAVMVNGPRLREAGALAELRDALAGGEPLSGRRLSDILMRHVHPEWRRYHWASSNFSTRPFALMWDAPDGWLCRNFHLHPLAVDLSVPQAMECLRSDTIDGEFVGRAIGVWDDIHVVQDSDDLLMCTLTPDDVTYSEPSEEPAGLAAVRRAAYGEANVNALHRWYLTKATKIHTGDLDARWKAIEEETGHLVFEVLSQHRMQDVATVDGVGNSTIMTDARVTYEAFAGNTTPSAGTDRYDNVLEEGVRISDGTELQSHCSVGRHTELNGATLYPWTKVGRYCSIAKNAALGASDHPITGLSSSLSFPSVMGNLRFVGAEIGHDVWVGTNATILAGVKIGHGAVIGANALVTKDVRPYAIVVGQPAREIRRRFPDDVCQALLVSRWWEVPYAALREVTMSDPVEALRRITGLRREAADIEPEAIAFLEDWLASRPPAIAVAG